MGPEGEPQRVGMNQIPNQATQEVPPEAAGPLCFHPDADLYDDDRKTEVVKRIYSTFEQYRDCDERQEMEWKWRMVHDHYFGLRQTNSIFEYQIREVYRQVQTTIAQVSEVLLGGDEIFNFKARQPGFDDDAEGATAIVMDMLERFGGLQEIEACLQNSIIYGMGYTLEGWRSFRKTQYKAQSMHGDGFETMWERKTNEVIENAATLESIPPWCVYSHPAVPDIRNSPMAFLYRGGSAGDLKTLIREGYIDAQATKEAIENGGSTPNVNRQSSPVRHWNDTQFLDTDENTHEILYCWDFSGWHYIILDGKWIVRAMPIEGDGQYPLRGWPNDQHAETHWGQPDPLLILEEQKLLNEITSLYVKSIWLALPRFKIKQNVRQRYDDQTLKPGGRLVVDDMEDIHMIETNAAVPQMQEVCNWILSNMQAASGSSKEIAGTGSDQKTATGLVRLQNAASKRFQHKIRLMVPVLKGAMRGLYDLCARYCEEEYSFKIAGEEGGAVWKHYDPKVFSPNIDVQVEVGTGAGPEQATQLMEALKLAAGNPLIQAQELWSEFFKALGLKRVKRFFANTIQTQGDITKQFEMLMTTGIIEDAKPSDNHQMCLTILGALLTQYGPMMPPDAMMRGQERLQQHQAYLQAMMAQMGAQVGGPSQPGSGPPPDAGEVGNEANGRANGRFNMAARGRGQQAPMPNRGAA